ncbi:MAG: hypothetical protein ACREMA_09085 [Longimicrobiales bacterium]
MPRNKDLKRLVRDRMNKTGEAYTTARAQIVKKPGSKIRPAAAAHPAADDSVAKPVDFEALAGLSDPSPRTGRTWQQWTEVLDRAGAADWPHRDIAALVNEKYGVDGWWSQTVTVGYERIKGLRVPGQRRDGTYEANKSRTFDVPVSTLFDAWAEAARRKRWLEASVTVRTARAPVSLRLGWSDGSIIAVGFTAKGRSKSSVALSHTKLRDRESAEQLKQYWSERLDALGELLARARKTQARQSPK